LRHYGSARDGTLRARFAAGPMREAEQPLPKLPDYSFTSLKFRRLTGFE
jgi:hypothetical protein